MQCTPPVYLSVFLFTAIAACGDDVVRVGDVMFPDPELQRCYEAESFRYPDDWDVSVVPQMLCGDPAYDIRDLSGIGVLSGLRGLTLLRQQNIDDYSPLLELPGLIELELRESRVENKDLNIISHLTRLEWLTLDDTSLGDISSIGNLQNLEYLSLTAAGITAGVDSLTSLTELMYGYFDVNPESPCVDLEVLRNSLPGADISPNEPIPGFSCSE